MTKSGDDRELARVLRRLSVGGATLVADGDGFRIAGGSAGRSGGLRVSASVARELLSRELIARTVEGGFVLSGTGKAFLRRRLAGADGFAAQHQMRAPAAIREAGESIAAVVVNLDESPLAGLRARKGRDGRPLIEPAEFAAGERFRADYSRACIMPRVTANWTAAVAPGRRDGGAGGMAEFTGAVLDARRRVEAALTAVGPDFAGLLVDFCCFLKGIEEIERDRQWPTRSAKLVLRLALASLARHYGLSATAEGPERSRLRHWGTEDYRPTID
jgi:hypothetical protein